MQHNVTIEISLAVLYRITEASKTIYRIAGLDGAILTIVNGTVKSILGKVDLDCVQSNQRHQTELQEVSEEWEVKLTHVEITEVEVDDETKSAMQQQLNAERKGRGSVTEEVGRK